MVEKHFASLKEKKTLWITKLDKNTPYFYGFLRGTLINKGLNFNLIGRDRIST